MSVVDFDPTVLTRFLPLHPTPQCNCWNKANYLLEGKCCESSIMCKATLKSNGTARHYYGCSETEFKPVSTTTNKALYIDTKEMPRNCQRRSGMPKAQKQTLASNGVSRQKLVHINREQNRATSDLP